jgi:ribonuclease Z
MKNWLTAILITIALLNLPDNLRAQVSSDISVTLLGTGTPVPIAERFGPSTLVEAGPEKLLFDCGRGCPIRLTQKNVPLRDVKLFLTHLHSDHLNGIPDLWLTGWLGPSWGAL